MSLEVIEPKNIVINQQPIFFLFSAPTLGLTDVVTSPDNFEFSEIFFRSHGDGGKILKVIKAQANRINPLAMTAKYL